MLKKYGGYALLGALGLAVVVGLVPSLNSSTVRIILIILGLVAGLVNVTGEHRTEFLMATIALMLVGDANLDEVTSLGEAIERILYNIRLIAGPAALVGALAIIISTAREKQRE
ncbi:MAG: hypothetical protein ACYS9X_05225 [Planctomycetota bacterium]|jgi:hypothetical protein